MKKIMLTTFMMLSASIVWAKPPPMTFEELDSNNDGYISQKEAKARKDLIENWKSADKNHDGKLNSDEFITYEGRNSFEPPQDSMDRGIGAAPYP